jgi:hypothetical protein
MEGAIALKMMHCGSSVQVRPLGCGSKPPGFAHKGLAVNPAAVLTVPEIYPLEFPL